MVESKVRNLLTHGTPIPPQLLLPERRKIEPLVQAKTLASLPPPLDAIPPTNSESCTVFHIRMPIEKQAPPSINIIVLNFSDSTNILQNTRQVDRGLQRVAQYERLINLIAEFERKMRCGLKPSYSLDNQKGPFLVTPGFINKLKYLAASFYTQELAEEPFTKELAKAVKARTVLDEKAVVLEAERIIFDHQRAKFSNIKVKRTEITSQANQPAQKPDKKVEKQIEKGTTPKSPASESVKPQKEIESEKAVETPEERARLDKPGRETAKFFEELWSRPF